MYVKRCERCGKGIETVVGSGRFCSSACSHSFSTSRNRSEINAKVSVSLKGRKVTLKSGVCPMCGERFEMLLRKPKTFCTRRCSYNARKKPLDGYDGYKRECQFQFSLSEYPNEFDFELVKKYGWYTAKNRGNNANGVSRDHIVSIRWGYENGVDAKNIRHPANCQLLLQRKNVSKGKKRSISVEELITRIDDWNKRYTLGL